LPLRNPPEKYRQKNTGGKIPAEKYRRKNTGVKTAEKRRWN